MVWYDDPGAFNATATGMIVTRAVSDGSLNEDATQQFAAQPKAFMITGGVLAILLVLPGMPPEVPDRHCSNRTVIAGYQLSKRMEAISRGREEEMQSQLAMEEQDQIAGEEENFKDINNVYSLISVEPIEVEFGYSLIPLVDESSGGKLIDRIVIFRRQYAQDMGLVIPSIRLRDSSALNTNQYVIKIKGEVVAKGEIFVVSIWLLSRRTRRRRLTESIRLNRHMEFRII